MGFVKVEIRKPLATAFLATLGVLAAFSALVIVAGLLLNPSIDSRDVRAACAEHGGVESLSEGTTFMDGLSFVVCRDGWFERVDN